MEKDDSSVIIDEEEENMEKIAEVVGVEILTVRPKEQAMIPMIIIIK
jgi:hypothetical protein